MTQALSVLLCALLLTRCASNTIDQAVPSAVQQPAQNSVQAGNSTGLKAESAMSIKNTGQYPNINIVPSGEVPQLSDTQTAVARAELEGQALAQQQSGESAEIYVERLRRLQKLGSTHAASALREIEKSE